METFQSTASMRAPQVNYNMPARMPTQEIQSPDIQETTPIDWAEVVKGIGQGIAKTREVELQQKQETAMNNIAKKALIIAEKQRQGSITASQADTEFRALRMEGLSAGIGEKALSETIGRYNYGIEELEEARQKNMMTAEQNFRNAEIDNARKMYPGIAHLSNNSIQNIFDNVNASFDAMNKYNQQLAQLDPMSEDYKLLKESRDEEFEDVAFNNMLLEMNTVLANNQEVTPEIMRLMKNQGIMAGIKNGQMSYEEASLAADIASKRLGADSVMNKTSEFWKQSAEYRKQGTEYMIQNYKNKAINTDNVGLFMALAGDEFGKELMVRNRPTWTAAIDSLAKSEMYVDKDGRVRSRAAVVLNSNDVVGVLNGVNKANTNPVFSPYQRGQLSNVAMDVMDINNTPQPGQDDSTLDIISQNVSNFFKNMNEKQLDYTIATLNKSDKPEDRELAQRLTENKVSLKANGYASQMLKKNNPDNTIINRLNTSLIADNLRYTTDGKLVVKKPEGTFSPANAGMLFSSDEYKESVDKMNEYLSRIPTAEERIATLQKIYPNKVQALEVNADVETFEESEPSEVQAVRSIVNALKSARQPTTVSPEEMKAMDEAVESGEAVKVSTGDRDLDNLYKALSTDLKPNVKRAVQEAIKLKGTASVSSSTPLAFAGGVRPVEDSDRMSDEMVVEYNMQQDPENITYQRQLMADEADLQERQTRAVANARQAVNRIKEYGTNKETSKDVINAFKELEEAYGSWESIPEDILNDLQ